TEGRPEVDAVQWLGGDDERKDVLISIEKQSEHPLAGAVVKHFSTDNLVAITNFESITGKGAKADFEGETYYVGNQKLLTNQGVTISEDLQKRADEWSTQSKTVIWFANNKEALAVLAISDKIKETSVQAIQALKDLGIELYMLTGDNEATARSIAAQTGIKHFKAEVLRSEEHTSELQSRENLVCRLLLEKKMDDTTS